MSFRFGCFCMPMLWYVLRCSSDLIAWGAPTPICAMQQRRLSNNSWTLKCWRKAAHLRFLCISLSGLGTILRRSVKIGWAPKALMLCKYHLLQFLGHVMLRPGDLGKNAGCLWECRFVQQAPWLVELSSLVVRQWIQHALQQIAAVASHLPVLPGQFWGTYSGKPLVDTIPTSDLQSHKSFWRRAIFCIHGAALSTSWREDLCRCGVEPLRGRMTKVKHGIDLAVSGVITSCEDRNLHHGGVVLLLILTQPIQRLRQQQALHSKQVFKTSRPHYHIAQWRTQSPNPSAEKLFDFCWPGK